MTNFKGTKGKWEYSWQPVISNGLYIQTINKNHKNSFIGEIGGGLQSLEETKANALVISKAPEMLEMLERIYNGNHFQYPELGKEIKQLIKSATEL